MKLESNNPSSDQEQSQETAPDQIEQSQETTELPYVPDNDSTIIERGLDSESLIKK